MKSLVGFIQKVLVWTTCALLTALVLLMFSNVISRYFLNISIAWAEELSRFMMIWMVFIGAVIAYGYNEHLGLDILLKVVPQKVSYIIMMAANILILAVTILVIDGGIKLTVESIDSLSSALEIPNGYVYSIVPVCGVLMFFQTIDKFWKYMKLFVSNKPEGSTIV